MAHGNHAVKIRAANANAAIGENVSSAVRRQRALRGNADNGEIRRAAADIHDEHQLLTRHAAFVFERRRDGLELEADMFETQRAHSGFEIILRAAVSLCIAFNELDRAAKHNRIQRVAGEGFRLVFQVADEHRQNVRQGEALALQAGFLVKKTLAEDAFERPHEAARLGICIIPNGMAAEQGAVSEAEENRAGNGDLRAFDRGERHRITAENGNCGV